MYLNTNMSALETIQALNQTNNAQNQSIEQLSTGDRITSAASDPAGLAITQLMQSQINGLNQANQNAQNGVSLLQTADGAMSNIDTILQSMRSLASEAATGTNNAGDLQDLQAEMNQYAQEITSIANTTQFNNINLLSGGFQNQSIQTGANEGQSLSIGLSAMDAVSLGVAGLNASVSSDGIGVSNLQLGAGLSSGSKYDLKMTSGTAAAVTAITATGTNTTQAFAVTTAGVTGTYDSSATTTYTITIATVSTTGKVATFNITGSDGFSTVVTATYSTTSGTTATLASALSFTDGTNHLSIASTDITINTTTLTDNVGNSVSFNLTPAQATFQLETAGTSSSAIGGAVTVSGYSALSSTITVGDTTTGQNANGQVLSFQLSSGASALKLVGLGASNTSGTTEFTAETAGQVAGAETNGNLSPANYASVSVGLNISTQASAEAAMSVIDTAIQTVDNQRASVGAWMNQLSFAESNAQTESTNLQSANAGYLDANMPQVTAQFMQQQVLVQADVGLLSQADQLPANLLKLLP